MKSRLIFTSSCVLAAWSMSAAVLIGAEAAPAGGGGNAGPTMAGTRAKPVLDKGLTAEEVLKRVGKPTGIKPMDAPAGSKAEMWIYRRQAGTNSRMVEVSVQSVPMFVGLGTDHPATDVPVPDFQVENTVTYQVTALLMVDGKLALARQWKETERNYTK